MKNVYNIYYIIISYSFICCLLSCNDTILDKQAQNLYTENTVWSDINLAESYLLNGYDNLAMGFSALMLTAITDESRYEFSWGPENYVQGFITADNPRPFVTDWHTEGIPHWEKNFKNIQSINIFLENVEDVITGYPDNQKSTIADQIETLKGEALFLRAFNYGQLLMTYGGVPILKKPNMIGEDFQNINRSSFKETLDFVIEDCEKAIESLPSKKVAIMGRANKEAAMAWKSRVLLFAASDLIMEGGEGNEYFSIPNADRESMWRGARDAAKTIIDSDIFQLDDFGSPDKELIAQNYYDFFRQKDLSSDEIIWGKMYSKAEGFASQMNLWNGPNGNNNWSGHNPTQQLVDSYEMEDGSKFSDHFTLNSEDYYKNVSDKYTSENPYENREPRFYASILFDGAKWQPRFENLAGNDPEGIYDRRTRIIMENGKVVSSTPGIDTRQGPVEDWNGSFTGYVTKKLLDIDVIGKNENNDHSYITFRYPEILLNYAEALIALGEADEAAIYINMIRHRSGLPDFSGDIMTALRHERKIELSYEEIRWYDLRRWQILDEALGENAYGIDIREIRDENGVNVTWKRIIAEERRFDSRMYWAPIPTDEMNKAPNLVQNPGY